MKTKEEQADNYTQMQYVDYGDFSYRAEEQIREGFLAGYDSAIEKVKEYLFNTENHNFINDVIYISPEYLKQTIKFLNEQ